MLASLALGLDFTNPGELELFTVNRPSLFAIGPRLIPVLALAVVQMTELNRHQRARENLKPLGLQLFLEKVRLTRAASAPHR